MIGWPIQVNKPEEVNQLAQTEPSNDREDISSFIEILQQLVHEHSVVGTALFTAQEKAGKSLRYALAWMQRENKTTRPLLILYTSSYPQRPDQRHHPANPHNRLPHRE